MTSKDILSKLKAKVGLGSTSSETGKGKSKLSKNIQHGFHLAKGKTSHPMEDYLVAQFKNIREHELGLFAIFDGHLGHNVADYLQVHLFNTIINQPEFWSNTESAIREAYFQTDKMILDKAAQLGRGGSTAVTAILIDCETLIVANVGDSRAVLLRNGVAEQLSVDHEPSMEQQEIENRGGFVSNMPGDVPRVDGQLAVSRAFGDRSLKIHISSDPYVTRTTIDPLTNFLILASDGLWKVMTNEEAVVAIKDIKNPQLAAKHLVEEAISRKSKDDISCIVVMFNN